MSNKLDIKEAIERWNMNNPSFKMSMYYDRIIQESSRVPMIIQIESKDRETITLTGYEGEEYLWSDIINRISI